MTHPVRKKIIDRVAARFGKTPRAQTRLPGTQNANETLRAVFMGLWGGVAVLTAASAIEITGNALGVRDDRKFAEASLPLTAGEGALARAVFGPDFDTQGITKHFHRDLPPHQRPHDTDAPRTAAYVVGGNDRDIHFISANTHARDYSRVPDQGAVVGTFMHEMTHIWQHRQGMTADCDTYDYALTEQSRFADFCNEQQASIVGEYTRVFLQPDSLLGKTQGLIPDLQYSAAGRNLIRVVEEQFPQARLSRLAMQARFNAAGQCVRTRARAVVSTQQLHRFDLHAAWESCAAQHVTTFNGERLSPDAAGPVLPAVPPRRGISAQVRLFWANTIG